MNSSGRLSITAAVARRPGAPFSLEAAEIEAPRAGEVRVRLSAVGLCHTDLVARDQFIPIPLPAVLGHEGAGVVESIGDGVNKVVPGDHVVMSFASCGRCRQCENDLPCYCDTFPALNFTGARADGSSGVWLEGRPISGHFFGQSSFATYALAYERNLIRVPKDLPLERLAPLGCGLQTGAGAVMRSLACSSGASIAIFGGGPVGLAAVMAARIRGCDPVVLVEPLAARRTLALSLGASHAVDPACGDVGSALRAIAPQGLQFALETSGREDVVATGLAALSSHGLIGLVGVPPKPESSLSLNLASLITFGHRIHGIIEGDSDLDNFITDLIALYRGGQFPLGKLISTYPFDKINAAFDDQVCGHCVKAVLIFDKV